jgi:hypothetical protein
MMEFEGESSPSCYNEALAIAHYEATPEDSIEPVKRKQQNIPRLETNNTGASQASLIE